MTAQEIGLGDSLARFTCTLCTTTFQCKTSTSSAGWISCPVGADGGLVAAFQPCSREIELCALYSAVRSVPPWRTQARIFAGCSRNRRLPSSDHPALMYTKNKRICEILVDVLLRSFGVGSLPRRNPRSANETRDPCQTHTFTKIQWEPPAEGFYSLSTATWSGNRKSTGLVLGSPSTGSSLGWAAGGMAAGPPFCTGR